MVMIPSRRLLLSRFSFLRLRKMIYIYLFFSTFVLFIIVFHQYLTQADANFMQTEVSRSTSLLPTGVSTGNAEVDGKINKGWWVGHFGHKSALHHSESVETKWVVHGRGATNGGFVVNKYATSMAILISGRHRIEFGRTSVVLETSGDYVIWGPGVAHSWTALSPSTVMCIRWPSLTDDQKVVNNSYTSRIKARQLLASKQKSTSNN